jgi:hypothetical protein
MNNPIQVTLGLASKEGGPFEFVLHDEGARVCTALTAEELQIAAAVLRDLADAIDVALRSLAN